MPAGYNDVSATLCEQVLDAGFAILDAGVNPRIRCANKDLALCEEIINTAKQICSAGVNARFGCVSKETEEEK